MKHNIISAFCILLSFTGCKQEKQQLRRGQIYVNKVLDGDTFVSNGISYRIAEIDAPEKDQDFGQQSKMYLTELIEGKSVKIDVQAKDKYGRNISQVYVNNQPISERIVGNGYAWHYKRYSKSKRLAQLQRLAQQNKKGLWKYNAIEPYKFRKLNK